MECTIHWLKLPAFSEEFPSVTTHESLFADSGKIFTYAGELASFDLVIDVIARIAGSRVALNVCHYALVGGQRPGELSQTIPAGLKFATSNRKLAHAITLMKQNIEVPLSLNQIPQRSSLSRRQLERLFIYQVGTSSLRHHVALRVDFARRLLGCSGKSIIDTAIAIGFPSASHFSRSFKQFQNVTLTQYRQRLPNWVGTGMG